MRSIYFDIDGCAFRQHIETMSEDSVLFCSYFTDYYQNLSVPLWQNLQMKAFW